MAVDLKQTTVNPVVIVPETAFNAAHAKVWAEGTDEQVEELGGVHSAKTWATSAEGYASDPNIVACGTNIQSINTVASNISDVNSVASNMSTIAAAQTYASNAQKWAEGADSAVTPMGGTHSAKGWAEQAQSIVSSIGTVLHYKGSVADYAALQAVTGQIVGDVYNVTDTGDNYAWDGTSWDKLSGTVDLSAYRTASAQDVIDAGKQPLLPAGTTGYYLQKTSDGVQWSAVQAGGPTFTWFSNKSGVSFDTEISGLENKNSIVFKNGLLLEKGVYSGIHKWYTGGSGGKVLNLTNAIDFRSADSWEIQTTYLYKGGGSEPMIVAAGPADFCGLIFLTINGSLKLYIGSVIGSNWDYFAGEDMGISMIVGTTYHFKLGYTSTGGYYLDYHTGSGTYSRVWYNSQKTEKTRVNGTFQFMNWSFNTPKYYSEGSIDWTTTKITVDGVDVFDGSTATSSDYTNVGCTEEQLPNITKDYDIIGSDLFLASSLLSSDRIAVGVF